MEIYLPVAEMSVFWLWMIGLGLGVGFLSGMFGVGGGFLMTPLLVFSGIPSTVAVATTLSHVTASSVSGALTQWRKRAIDFTMAGVMLAGGVAGILVGIWLFALMRRQGQMDLIVSLTYVLMLGSIGIIMLRESLATLKAYRAGTTHSARLVNHVWIHGLPLKMRFRQSRLYISVIPPVVIGFFVGMLSAIMGIGGGFIIVPAMIYLLRMPTNVVMGTSLVQIIAVTAITTVLQATNNYSVDIVLALLLVIGGVVGAQLGVRAGAKLRGEQLRLLLAIIVLTVCVGLLWGLIVRPSDVYSLTSGAAMRRAFLTLLGLFLLLPGARRRSWCPASARTLSRSPPTIPAPRSWCSAPSSAAKASKAATSWWWCAAPTRPWRCAAATALPASGSTAIPPNSKDFPAIIISPAPNRSPVSRRPRC